MSRKIWHFSEKSPKILDLEYALSCTLLIMEKELTIQQVAEYTGVSAHTLRYYERIGLLDGVERASSGHRRYATKDITWIRMLRRLRETGMHIRQMQEFADLRRQGEHTLTRRLALLKAHQQEVLEHVRELEGYLTAIENKIQLYRAHIAQEREVGLDLTPAEDGVAHDKQEPLVRDADLVASHRANA
jgi:DNA-binding transcriptional MerR regulator